MVPHDQARVAYSVSNSATRTPRTQEYEAIAQITRRLQRAAQRGKLAFSELAEALHENRRMWALFATSVADEENSLPRELRAQIFYLAEFTNAHSGQVLAGKASVRPLLEVNAAVLRGLRERRLAA